MRSPVQADVAALLLHVAINDFNGVWTEHEITCCYKQHQIIVGLEGRMQAGMFPGAMLLFSCVCVSGLNASAQTGSTSNAPATQAHRSPPYVMHSGDDLDIVFAYNPELNQHAPVRPDGRISMPLLGELQAEGLTVQQFTEQLDAAYASQLKRTSISVQIRAFPNQVFYVGGEVQRPGVLAFRGQNTSALQAITEAGGVKESAATGSVLVLRKALDGTIEVHQLSLKADKGQVSSSARFSLQPLDVLLITESRISKIDRFIDQYTRRLSPVLLTGGFTYLFGNTVSIP